MAALKISGFDLKDGKNIIKIVCCKTTAVIIPIMMGCDVNLFTSDWYSIQWNLLFKQLKTLISLKRLTDL